MNAPRRAARQQPARTLRRRGHKGRDAALHRFAGEGPEGRRDHRSHGGNRRPAADRFSTLFIPDLRAIVKSANGLTLDLFDTFLEPLERGLGLKSVHSQKRPQDISESQAYNFRIRATDFALATDDGRGERLYSQADLILLGVSRSGKTPTCLYLALHYGIFAANYPLDEDDFESTALPKTIAPYRGKLYGVTISPERLRSIRLERRAAGRYASPQQVSFELRAAESLYSRYGIPFVDATHSSIEEIASTILSDTGLERHARTY
jgi:[pyruvate, water dikinase]-phosphate phosphotransferase / [pyruvate, water dikinase] kinase